MTKRMIWSTAPVAATLLMLINSISMLVSSNVLLNVGVLDWQSIDGERPLDEDLSRSMTMNFLLAAQHFNERRVEVLPVLGEAWVQSCPVNISIVHYCDTQAMLRKTVFNTGEVLPDVDAIAGYATAAEGRHGALAADVLGNVPIVSHWCTTPQTENRDIFPMFTRTVVADSNMAERIAKFILQMNFTQVAGLAMREDSAPELTNEIKKRLLEGGCLAEFFDFSNDDLDSMETAVKNVAESGLNVIIVIAYNFVILDDLARVAAQYGLTADNKLIVFTNMDFELNPVDFENDEHVTAFVRGAFRVATMIDSASTEIQNYLNLWVTEFDSKYRDYVNSILPPNGDGNDHFVCLNEEFNMTIPPNFCADNVGKYTEMWGIAYDAMLSIALGACKSNGVNRGLDLAKDIMSLNFTGLSGSIMFDNTTGNRLRDSFQYQVQNFQPSGETYQARLVAMYDLNRGEFVFENASALYFKTGLGLESMQFQFDPPLTNYQYLPLLLRAIGIAAFLVVVLSTIICSLWLLRYRHEKIVVNSQGPLLQLINCGCFVAAWAILLMSLDDNPDQMVKVNMDSVCMAIPVLFSIGFQIALLGLCGKTYRIYSIWNNKRIMTKRFSIRKVVMAIVFMVVVELIVLICWITIAPLTWKRLVLSTDRFGQPLLEIGLCDAETWTSGSFAVVVLVLHGLLLLVIGMLAYQVSDMPGEFGEARWLGIACVLLSQIYLISLPAIAAVYSVNVSGRFILATAMVFISASALLFVMFVPKMYFLATGKEIFTKGTTNSRLQLDLHGSKDNNIVVINPMNDGDGDGENGARGSSSNINAVDSPSPKQSLRKNIEALKSKKVSAGVLS